MVAEIELRWRRFLIVMIRILRQPKVDAVFRLLGCATPSLAAPPFFAVPYC